MSGFRVIVLGSAAGGGYPQWNCRGPVSRLFWDGDPRVEERTQSSLAVSDDGGRWALLNCSPDIRQQILRTPALQPWRRQDAAGGGPETGSPETGSPETGGAEAGPDGEPAAGPLRRTPIASILLTNGDIDHIAGLLSLRERQPFRLLATPAVLEVLRGNRIFDALAHDLVERCPVSLNATFPLVGALTAEIFAVPGKVPLYLEEGEPEIGGEGEATVGVRIAAPDGRQLFYIPGCARVTPALKARVTGADLLLFDGTLWDDAEMIDAGLGHKSGRRMGHVSMSGPDGSLAAFRDLPLGRRVFVHINNTNPVLVADTPQRAEVAAAGWEIAYDGLEIAL